MGSIVTFPEGRRPLSGGRIVGADTEPADVIILPVIRIERPSSTPADDGRGGGSDTPRPRKRRRVSRS